MNRFALFSDGKTWSTNLAVMVNSLTKLFAKEPLFIVENDITELCFCCMHFDAAYMCIE